MANDEKAGQSRQPRDEDAQAREIVRMIALLMSEPLAERAAITVVGDPSVFAVNPIRRLP